MPIGPATGRIGAAMLALAAAGGATAATAADIPGDASTKAVLKTGAPGVEDGTFERFGDSDWYRIALRGGQNYAVHAGITIECGGMAVSLRDPKGRVVATASSGGGGDGGAEYRPARDATYFVEFRSTNSAACVPYPAPYAGEVVADARRDITTDAVLRLGETLTPRFNYGFDNDFFRMTLEGGVRYAFTFTQKGGSEVSVSLLDAKGRLVPKPWDAAAGTTRFKVARSGTYFLDLRNGPRRIPTGLGGVPYSLRLTSP